MIQLLDYGKGEKFIRCGYYKKDIGTPDKEYRWGSQTTFISKIGTFRKLVKKAKKAGII